MDELRSGGSVDLSAKNLGEEGCAYVVEALAFNDRCCAMPGRAPPCRPAGTPRDAQHRRAAQASD